MSATGSPSQQQSYFKVHKSWSKAGIGTCVVLEGGMGVKTTKIALDIGCTPIFDVACQANVVLISHGHVDHIGGIFGHARVRSVSYAGAPPPTYFVPFQFLRKLQKARRTISEIDAMTLDDCHEDEDCGVQQIMPKDNDESQVCDSSILPMNFIGVRPGEEIPLKLKGMEPLVIKVFGVEHRHHPAVGYCITRQIPSTLKSEYRHLSKEEIRKLLGQGVDIKTETKQQPEVGYTGDTCKNGLLLQPWIDSDTKDHLTDNHQVDECDEQTRKSQRHLMEAFRSPLLICELTYLEKPRQSSTSKQRCIKNNGIKNHDHGDSRGHMCLPDVMDVFQSHFSKVNINAENHIKKQCAERNSGDIVESYDGKSDLGKTALHMTSLQQDSTLENIFHLPKEVHFVHFSAKYTIEQILERLSKGLASWLLDVTHVSVVAHSRQLLHGGMESSSAEGHSGIQKKDSGSENIRSRVCYEILQANGCMRLKDYEKERD